MSTVDLEVQVAHAHVGAALNVLRTHQVLDVAYDETGATICVRIEPASAREAVEDALRSASQGSVVVRLPDNSSG